jgi:hypothetical protein
MIFCKFVFQVTGVVGRAEILSSAFFLAAFIFYTKATRRKKFTGQNKRRHKFPNIPLEMKILLTFVF